MDKKKNYSGTSDFTDITRIIDYALNSIGANIENDPKYNRLVKWADVYDDKLSMSSRVITSYNDFRNICECLKLYQDFNYRHRNDRAYANSLYKMCKNAIPTVLTSFGKTFGDKKKRVQFKKLRAEHAPLKELLSV